MVKLFAISVLFKSGDTVKLLKAAYSLQSFGFFQRGSVQEFMSFTSKIIAERTNTLNRQSIKEQDYMCHAFVRPDNLVGVLISDHEYPYRVAHNMISKVLDDFVAKVPSHFWATTNDTTIPYHTLEDSLAKWQNPMEADSLTRVQEEVEETKIILHNTIEAVLERGEKLDDLVKKSEMLSLQSKTFYTTAKKTNACCNFGS